VTSLLLVMLVTACAVVPRTGAEPGLERERQLVGLWLRPIRGAPDKAEEGLDVRAEGVFYLVGIHSMDGLTWRMDGDSLRLATATERYPEPFESTHRIERLTASTLMLSGDSYLGGEYTRSEQAPPTPTPTARRRAVAVDANRDRYCRVVRRLAEEDSSAEYAAFYFEAHRYRMSLRLIDEELDRGDRGVEHRRYFFDDERLYYYRADTGRRAGHHYGTSGRPEEHLSVSFDPEGRVDQAFRVIDGNPSTPSGHVIEGITDRADRLLADLRRTSECRRTPQEKLRDKRIKRLRERLRPGRGGGGH
jgi:hypothetical protein